MVSFKSGVLALAIAGEAFGAAQAQELNIFNARHYNTDRALYENFTRATGIKINMVEGGEDALVQRLKSEGAISRADLLVTTDAGRLAYAAGEGLLAPVKSAILTAAVPANLREPTGLWFGMSTRARVIIVNTGKVKPAEIRNYEDLADPKWKGRIVARTGSHIYNLSLLGSIIAADGEALAEQWARGVVANFARAPKGGDTDQIKAVAAGEADIAIANTYYFGNLLRSDKPEDKALVKNLAVIFPNQGGRGTHVNVSGVGLVKHAPNRDNAIRYMEYLASPEAQRYFADGNMEFPVNEKVVPHPLLAALGDFKVDTVNAASFASHNKQALMIMDRVGWK